MNTTMKNPYIIGITGGSGSGKTTLIHRLAELYSDMRCVLFRKMTIIVRETNNM